MTVQNLHLYFNVLLDRFGSPYFPPEEVDIMLNAAQNRIYNEYFPDNPDYRYNVEMNQHTTKALANLMDTAVIDADPVIDEVTFDDIDDTREISRILSLYTEDHQPINFTRTNDLARMERNDFTQANEEGLIYYFEGTTLKFKPTIEKNILINYMKEPLDISLNGNQTSELASFLHYDLVAEAINEAGVATRDQAMTQLNNI